MNSKQRVLAAINHEKTDRVPIDFAARDEVVKALMKHLNVDTYEDVLCKLGVDIRGVRPEYSRPNMGKAYSDPSIRIENDIYYDIWGTGFKSSETESGSYMDLAVSPLRDAESVADVHAHSWPSPDDYDYSNVIDTVNTYPEHWVFSHSRGIFEISWFLRGFDVFMVDLLVNTEIAVAIMDHVQTFLFERARRILEAGAGRLDMMEYNDDVGGQTGILMNPDTWRTHLKPRMIEFITMCREYNAKVRYHSCGGYIEIIPDLIEIGVDVLNPVQTIARGMNAEFLAAEFGDRLAFDGGVDTQELLPQASANQVRAEVRKLIDTFSPGFILAPSHVFQGDVPLENVLAVFEEALGTKL